MLSIFSKYAPANRSEGETEKDDSRAKRSRDGIDIEEGSPDAVVVDKELCTVCRESTTTEEGNKVLVCVTCGVKVHKACYSVDEVPEGDW